MEKSIIMLYDRKCHCAGASFVFLLHCLFVDEYEIIHIGIIDDIGLSMQKEKFIENHSISISIQYISNVNNFLVVGQKVASV